jgi:hypothetical protein
MQHSVSLEYEPSSELLRISVKKVTVLPTLETETSPRIHNQHREQVESPGVLLPVERLSRCSACPTGEQFETLCKNEGTTQHARRGQFVF